MAWAPAPRFDSFSLSPSFSAPPSVALAIDPTDPLTVFGALAMLIFLGFAGNLIFSKLKFNDTLILIFVGVLVGPVFGLVDQGAMLALSGIVGPLALILILFDGGLALKFRDLLHGLGAAALLGVVSFIATTTFLGGLTAVTLGTTFLRGAILGAILGGTSALVVLPSLENMAVAKKTGTILGLESALTDVLVVVVSFTLIAIAAAGVEAVELLEPGDADGNGLFDAWETENFGTTGQNATGDPDGDQRSNLEEMRTGTDPNYADQAQAVGGFDAQGIASKLLIVFSMSIFLGLAAGFLWLLIYPGLREKPFGYMLTLGFMFAMYVFVEWILQDVSQGGGPLAVLAFGIILGNNQSLGTLGRRVGDDFGATMKRFQGEVSFLVRTFFFVFLGIIVDLELIKDVKVIAISLLLLLGMAAARYLAVLAVTRRVVPRGDDLVMIMMMPRGLAAAVLAAIPFTMELPQFPGEFGIPGTEEFVALAFLVLVWTNLLATIAGMVLEGGDMDAAPGSGPGPKKGGAATKTATKTSGRAPAKKTAKKASKKAAKKGAKKSARRSSSTQTALEDLGRNG